MAQLKTAGIFSSITSAFFPKEVHAEIRTEILDNGRVAVAPVYFIDGFEIPAEHVGASRTQSILGYNAVLSKTAVEVHAETQGRTIHLAKNKAAEFLTRLTQKGVALQSKEGRVRPHIDKVVPNLKMELRTDDSLELQTELSTSKGIVVAKPASLAQLRADDGWYAIGENLLHAAISNSPIDEKLFASNEIEILRGDAVPELLQEVDGNQSRFGLIERNERLEGVAVLHASGENRFLVDGDADSVSIKPQLVFKASNGKEYKEEAINCGNFSENNKNFRRVDAGWIKVDPEIQQDFSGACDLVSNAVGALSSIKGTEIPRALSILKQATIENARTSNPWSVYFSSAVEASHQLLDSPSQAIFRLNLVESDGRSLLALDPAYSHDRFELSHAEIQKLIHEGQDWVRRRNAWIKIDVEKQKKWRKSLPTSSCRLARKDMSLQRHNTNRLLKYFRCLEVSSTLNLTQNS